MLQFLKHLCLHLIWFSYQSFVHVKCTIIPILSKQTISWILEFIVWTELYIKMFKKDSFLYPTPKLNLMLHKLYKPPLIFVSNVLNWIKQICFLKFPDICQGPSCHQLALKLGCAVILLLVLSVIGLSVSGKWGKITCFRISSLLPW
jgi:hypothetical protein